MKKTLKKALALTLASVMALSLTACGSGSGSGSSDNGGSGDSGDGNVTLKFSWWGGDARHEATEAAIAAFMQKYPNITVEPEYGAWTGWEEKQALAIQGGNAADVMQINWNWITSYSGNGKNFVDLNQYSDVLDLTQFDESVLEQCKVGDALMAVPIALTGRVFYWNKTTFDEIGCPIPTDKDSLLAAGAAFQAYGEDYYPLAMNELDRTIFLVYYLESVYGKPWVENGELQYSAEEIQEGLDFITELENAHVIPTMSVLQGDMADSLDKNAKWIDGKYAGIYEWDSSAGKFQQAIVESTTKPNQEFVVGDFIDFGDYDGGFTKISMAFAVSANSEHPKEAAMLINFLLNEDEGIEILGTERGIPCSAAASALLEEKEIGDALVKEANAKVIEHCKFPLDPYFEHNDLKANPDGVYYKVMGKLSAGDETSAEAAAELIEGIEECYSSYQ